MFELRPHQENAVAKMHNGCILCADMGTGKTHTAVGYYLANEAPKDVYVITTAKMRDKFDWQNTFIEVGIGTNRETTMGSLLTVDSWNNIDKYKEVKDAFFIFDEQRLVGSGAWVKAFYKIAEANRWIMLSATPGDNWLDYVPVFRANGFIKNLTAFKADHVVYAPYVRYAKVLGYRQVGKLVKWRNQILVHMPYERHTERISIEIPCDYDHELMEKVVKKRWHVYEDRPLRDSSELFSVMRKVVNSDATRLQAIRNLWSKHPRLIVYYNFDYELDTLRTLAVTGWSTASQNPNPSSEEPTEPWDYLLSPEGMAQNQGSTRFQVAEWNGHKHEEIPKTERWVYLVQYVAGAEAWGCTETDAMAFYSLTYSYKNWYQAHGRIDRLTTRFDRLYYYSLVSEALIDRSVRRALSTGKSFNEGNFGKMSNLTW